MTPLFIFLLRSFLQNTWEHLFRVFVFFFKAKSKCKWERVHCKSLFQTLRMCSTFFSYVWTKARILKYGLSQVSSPLHAPHWWPCGHWDYWSLGCELFPLIFHSLRTSPWQTSTLDYFSKVLWAHLCFLWVSKRISAIIKKTLHCMDFPQVKPRHQKCDPT